MTITVAIVVVLALHPVDTGAAAIAIAGPLIAAGLLTTRCIDPRGRRELRTDTAPAAQLTERVLTPNDSVPKLTMQLS